MSAPAATWSGRGVAYAASAVHRSGPSLEIVADLLRPRSGDRILDLGTGTGHTAAFLAHASIRVTGVDPERDMLSAARRAYGDRPGLTFVQATAADLPFEDGAFDAAVARHTLHHHEDVRATLRELARVVRPGGRFVLVDETSPHPDVTAWLEAVERDRDPSHVATRDLEAWAGLLAEAGFTWILGDARTRYTLDLVAWLDRSEPPAAARERVLQRFRDASERVRNAFDIAYHEGEPVRFHLPMNIVLSRREEP